MKTDSWSPAKNPDVVVEHYSIPAFDEQHYPVFEIASGIKSNKYILTSDSVMISKLNPDTKRIWRPVCLSKHPVCSTEFIVYEAKKNGQRDYIYSLIDSIPFFNHLCSHTTGSTNSRQRATPKSTLGFSFLLPPDSVIEEFCHIVTPMYDLIASKLLNSRLSHCLVRFYYRMSLKCLRFSFVYLNQECQSQDSEPHLSVRVAYLMTQPLIL